MKAMFSTAALVIALALGGCGEEAGDLNSAAANEMAPLPQIAAPNNGDWREIASRTDEGFLLGNPDAPIEVQEWADFECPGCMQFATVTEPFHVVLMLDTSASMRRENLWPAVSERVDAVLKDLSQEGEFAVLTFDQVSPPSRVTRTVPRSPTITPRSSVMNFTSSSQKRVPDSTRSQYAPPSIVRMMVPFDPTANPFRSETNATLSRSSSTPVTALPQLDPPLVVRSKTPSSPAIQMLSSPK